MSKGNKPAIKLSVKLKDGGQREYPGAAWPSRFGDGDSYYMSLDDGWKLVDPDGTEYTGGRDGNAYIDLYENKGDRGARSAPKKGGDFGGDDFGGADFGDDDIPFAPRDSKVF